MGHAGLDNQRKSIPRDKVEDGFENILKSLQPTRQFFTLAKAMFKVAWKMDISQAPRDMDEIAKLLRDTEKQIETLSQRIVEADNARGIKAYEGKIATLEREKLPLAERAAQVVPPRGKLEEFLEPDREHLVS